MVKFLAYCRSKEGQNEPPQDFEWRVLTRIRQLGLEMPRVKRGFAHKLDGMFSSKQFDGYVPIWYWVVE